jgi:ribosome-associated toxin RatA of RatAB toxin-antitoxin module
MVEFTTTVNASLEKVWQHLILKIEHPEKFVPGVSQVLILDKNDKMIIRQMTVTAEGISATLVEKITFEPYKVRFLLLEHPKFEGDVTNEIQFISEKETQMTFTMRWTDKKSKIPFENQDLIQNAVLKTKQYIEENL